MKKDKERYLTEREKNKLKIELIKKGYTKYEKLAAKFGVTVAYISMILKGKRRINKNIESKFKSIGITIPSEITEKTQLKKFNKIVGYCPNCGKKFEINPKDENYQFIRYCSCGTELIWSDE